MHVRSTLQLALAFLVCSPSAIYIQESRAQQGAAQPSTPSKGPGTTAIQQTVRPPTPSTADVKNLFDTASSLISQSRFGEAADLLQKAETAAPDVPAIHHYLGYALWKQDRWSAAQKEFQRAHQLDTKNAYTLYFLARIAQSMAHSSDAVRYYEGVVRLGAPLYDTSQRLGQLYFDTGQFERARENIQAALKQTPWDSALYYQLGRIDHRTGHAEAAREEFASAERLKNVSQVAVQHLLALDRALAARDAEKIAGLRANLLGESAHDPEILESLGVLLGRAGLYDQAREPLERCVRLDPGSFEAEYDLGVTLLRLHLDRNAEATLLRALTLQPDSVEANRALAVLYVEQNRNVDAIERLRSAARVLPGDVKLLALLGQQYLQGRFVPNAIATLQQAVKSAPENQDVRFLLVQAYDSAHDYEAALACAEEGLRLFPDSGRASFEVAQELAALGRYGGARPYAERAVKQEPTLLEAWNLMGDLESKSGRYDRALEAFERARSIDPSSVIAARGVTDNLLRQKRYSEALAETQKALKIHPRDAGLYFTLMQAYVRTGQREQASKTAAIYQQLHASEAAQADAQKPRAYPEPASAANQSR